MNYEDEEINKVDDNTLARVNLEPIIVRAQNRPEELTLEEEYDIEGGATRRQRSPVKRIVKGTNYTGVFTCCVSGTISKLTRISNVKKCSKISNNQYKIWAETKGMVYCEINSKAGNVTYITTFKILYV